MDETAPFAATHRLVWSDEDGGRERVWDVRLVCASPERWLAATREDVEWDRHPEWTYDPRRRLWRWRDLPGFEGRRGRLRCVRIDDGNDDPLFCDPA